MGIASHWDEPDRGTIIEIVPDNPPLVKIKWVKQGSKWIDIYSMESWIIKDYAKIILPKHIEYWSNKLEKM